MRKLLLTFAGLAGIAGAAAGCAQAAPSPVLADVADALPVVTDAPQVQPVQYYDDWRHREWRRREAYERWRRHEAWRRWRHERDRSYGYQSYNGGW